MATAYEHSNMVCGLLAAHTTCKYLIIHCLLVFARFVSMGADTRLESERNGYKEFGNERHGRPHAKHYLCNTMLDVSPPLGLIAAGKAKRTAQRTLLHSSQRTSQQTFQCNVAGFRSKILDLGRKWLHTNFSMLKQNRNGHPHLSQ